MNLTLESLDTVKRLMKEFNESDDVFKSYATLSAIIDILEDTTESLRDYPFKLIRKAMTEVALKDTKTKKKA